MLASSYVYFFFQIAAQPQQWGRRAWPRLAIGVKAGLGTMCWEQPAFPLLLADKSLVSHTANQSEEIKVLFSPLSYSTE